MAIAHHISASQFADSNLEFFNIIDAPLKGDTGYGVFPHHLNG
jgi:hypothetical protein